MNEPSVARPWLATTPAGVIAAVEKLKHEDPEALFALLTRAAASGDWETFVPAFERASGVTGIKLLLAAPDGFPMRYAYENAGLPADLWPAFLAVLDVAARVADEAGDKLKAGKRLRDLVLARARDALPARDLSCKAKLAALLAE
jgi:hypothetical protein